MTFSLPVDSTSSVLSTLPRLMALQVWSKLVTFVCNVWIVRLVHPTVFGQFSVELTLALNVALFLSRDAVRNVTGRFDRATQTADAFAVSLLVLPVGVALSALLCALVPISGALALTLAAALVELASEPFLAVLQCQLLLSERIKVDGVATLLRCVSVIVALRADWQLMAFAAGQMVYAVTLLSGLVLAVHRHRLWAFCGASSAVRLLGVHAALLRGFYRQAVQSVVLTEAEKVALWFGASGFDQGTFAVVSNLGSLVARLVFLPVEETSKAVFQRERNHQRSATVLSLLVKMVAIVGLFAAVFGPAYAHTLLHLLYGSRISATSAPFVLQFYSVYILCMAVNGVSEAFVHATAHVSELPSINTAMVAISVAYIAMAGALLYAFGTVGLVLANCANMLMRTLFSAVYASRYFGQKQSRFALSECAPNAPVAATFGAALLATQLSRHFVEPQSLAAHVGVGALALAAVAAAIYVRERAFLSELRALLRGRADKQE